MLRLNRVLCLACLCGLWSCSKNQDTPVADATATPEAQAPAAAAGSAAAAPTTAAKGDGKTTTLTSEQAGKIADQLIVKGQFRDAVVLLTKLIQANPKATDAYVKRSAILAEHKQYTQAIADMTKAIEIAPKNARFHNTRGYFHLTQKNLPEALRDFDAAIALDPKFTQPHNNRGLVHIAMDDSKAAVADFDAAIAIDPKYLDAYNNRGYALMRDEQYEAAITSFSQVIDISPAYVNAWNNRGQARMKAGQDDAAITDFSEAIRLAPGNVGHYLGRADAYTKLGKATEAKADRDHVVWMQKLAALTQQALRNPKLAAHWIERGQHLMKGSDAKAALADFDRALKVSPGSIEARCGRAAAQLQLNDIDGAIRDCNIALQKEAIPLALSIRGDAYFQKGQLDEAIEDYGTAKRMDAQVAKAYEMRAEKYRAAGDSEKAEADMKQAAALDPSKEVIQQASAEEPAAN